MRSGSRLLVPVVAFALVGCGAPSHEYVRNTEVRAAFRIPSAWNVFSKELVLGLPAGPQADTPDPIKWLVGIDGDPEASPAHVLDPDRASDYPKGFALVEDLSFLDHDDASLHWLRNFMFPVDALAQNGSDARILAYDDAVSHDQVHGIHLEFQFRAAAYAKAVAAGAAQPASNALQKALLGGGAPVLSPKFVQVSQTALVDDGANRLYLMVVMCSAECYARNGSDIRSTVDSWTVLT